MDCDVCIIGAGPAGIFTALELLRTAPSKRIIMVENGNAVDKRHCPKDRTGACMQCKPFCQITTGFSGAGAFSDGKLSLSCEVGGDFPDLIGAKEAQKLIDYTDSLYLEFGATREVKGIGEAEKIKEIRKRAIKAGLKLVDCPIRHLGTEKVQSLYLSIQEYLYSAGVELLLGWECTDLTVKDGVCLGARISLVRGEGKRDITAAATVVAVGRRGADWMKAICEANNIAHKPGIVDIGVRVEVRNEIMEEMNQVLYEGKLIGQPKPFKNNVRTFCQNPGGFVSQENYDNNLAVVNGHSYDETKSTNTNLAILCSHIFSYPFNQPIEYAQIIGKLANMLGAGHILVQRYGDILDGKRTWQHELENSNVKPTLPDAVAGDITAALPYRSMMNILNFMQAVDYVVPGFASMETLLYAPELKFYSNRVELDEKLRTNIRNLHCLGDSSGWTRGLMMASAMGVFMGRLLSGNDS